MKIAVTAQGTELSSEVDPRFGRARYFIVVDTESDAVTAHDNNQNIAAAQGAGIQAAQQVFELGVEALLTGNVGPKAFSTLQAGNIRVYVGVTGTVGQVIEQFKAGVHENVTEANVEGHWV